MSNIKKSPKPEPKDLQRQIEDLTEALQRERADAVNIRRRHEEQIAGLKSLVKANVIRELLPAIDSFERLLKHLPPDSKDGPIVDGVTGIVKQLKKSLDDLGVERIQTVGEVFDPRYHEAVSMEEGPGTVEMISEELQAGYKIGDDVIRHAMVKVKMSTG